MPKWRLHFSAFQNASLLRYIRAGLLPTYHSSNSNLSTSFILHKIHKGCGAFARMPYKALFLQHEIILLISSIWFACSLFIDTHSTGLVHLKGLIQTLGFGSHPNKLSGEKNHLMCCFQKLITHMKTGFPWNRAVHYSSLRAISIPVFYF